MIPYLQRNQLYIPQTPTTYTLELTTRCNNACVGCGNVFSHGQHDMPVEEWQVLLDALRPHLVNIRITGGEPTLYPQFDRIIQFIDRLDVPFVLFTNGVWEDRRQIIQALKGCRNLDGILVSLHGKDAASHRQFINADSFDETMQSIEESTQAGISVNTNTILTQANVQDVEAIARLAFDLGAGSAAFSRYYGRSLPITDLDEGEFARAVETVHTLKERGLSVRFNNNVPACFSGRPSKSCPAGITHCTIDPCGKVRPCNHADVVLGDLFEQSIEAIWHSQEAEAWRGLIPSSCYRCAEFDRCRGGCKATALHLEQKHDPLMRRPLREPLKNNGTHKLQLYRESRPVGDFVLRRETFGLMLLNRGRSIVADFAAEALLDLLDGTHSLGAIEQQFDRGAIDFIGHLYLEGLIRFEE